MGYIVTGFARSLTVKVTKTVNGVIASGYPKYYDGKTDSGFLAYYSPTYSSISDDDMAKMSLVDFNARLADFVAWVEVVEPGLDMDVDLTVEARIASDDCTTSTTSTSTSTSTSTTTSTSTSTSTSTTTSTSSTTSTSTTVEPTTTTTTTVEITVVEVNCPDPTEWVTGQTTYPTRSNVALGTETGKVVLDFEIYPIPDRMVVWFDGTVVIDTGYRGSVRYDIGGDLRNTFKLSLNGKADPVAPYTYPLSAGDIVTYNADGYNVNQEIRSDGYPALNPDHTSTACFDKTTATATATLDVWAPLEHTGWKFIMYCPVIGETCPTTTTTTTTP